VSQFDDDGECLMIEHIVGVVSRKRDRLIKEKAIKLDELADLILEASMLYNDYNIFTLIPRRIKFYFKLKEIDKKIEELEKYKDV
jgi:hypothetical protein